MGGKVSDPELPLDCTECFIFKLLEKLYRSAEVIVFVRPELSVKVGVKCAAD